MKALVEGLFTVFKHLFKKPVTLEYPEKRRCINEKFRGKLIVEGCIGCGICQKVCPSGAIKIIKKNNTVNSYEFDLKKCIFCGNCKFYCPTGAVKMTSEFELGTKNKQNLTLTYKGRQND